MCIITASITVLNSDPALHLPKKNPHLNLHWFGDGKKKQGISLNGNRILDIHISHHSKGKDVCVKQCHAFKGYNTDFGATRYDEVYVSFASFEEANNAFNTPSWMIYDGVLLSFSGMIASMPTSYKDITETTN